MADTVSIKLGEYNDAVSEIKDGQKRLNKAYSDFKQEWKKSTLPFLDDYAATMTDIKKYLQKYADLLSQDIDKFKKIGKEIQKADNS